MDKSKMKEIRLEDLITGEKEGERKCGMDKDTKKVLVMQRSVYHKYAEIEVEVPNDVFDDDMPYVNLQTWLVENEDLYDEEMEKEMGKAEYELGFGCEYTGMDEEDNESEWRFEVVGENYGGHL